MYINNGQRGKTKSFDRGFKNLIVRGMEELVRK